MKKMFISKKSQFFLFTAIILMAYAAGLLAPESVVPDASTSFRDLYKNFAFESPLALNNALFEGKNVNAEYERFLDKFISYSKMKKTGVEIFSVLESGNQVYFSNKMSNSVKILNLNQTISPGVNTAFLRSNLSEVVLEVRDDVFHENIYKLTISDKGTDGKAVLRVKIGSKRQIFVLE